MYINILRGKKDVTTFPDIYIYISKNAFKILITFGLVFKRLG